MEKDKKESFIMFLIRSFCGFLMWLFILPITVCIWTNIGYKLRPDVFKSVDVSQTGDFFVALLFTVCMAVLIYLLYLLKLTFK